MERNKYIGGSDAGAILGVNPWKCKTQVWLEKTELSNDKETNNNFTYWGNQLERIVAEEAHKQVGGMIRKGRFIKSKVLDYVGGTPDYIIYKNDVKILIECKTTDKWNNKEWQNEEAPDTYIAQVHHYLMLTDCDYGYLAVLIGGNDFKLVKVERNKAIEENLMKIYKDFWENYVVKRIPPPDDKITARTLNILYPASQPKEIQIEGTMVCNRIKNIKAEIKEREAELEILESKVKQELAEAEIGITNDGKYKVSWKSFVTKRFDTKKFKEEQQNIYEQYLVDNQQRRLTITEIKPKLLEG